jgi:hypothetical protein
VVGLAVLLGGGELLARAFEPQLAAAGDRVTFKAALFQRQGPTECLLIGTSRFNDGLRGRDLKAFNASVPSSSLAVQARLFDGGLVHEGLKRVVLEVSPEVMWGDVRAERSDVEPFALLRERRGLAVENWPRLFALPFASHFDGSEWFRSRWVHEWWVERSGIEPLPELPGPVHVEHAKQDLVEPAVDGWVKLAQRGRAWNIVTVFVAPPADPDRQVDQCNPRFQAMLKQLAWASESQVLDYGCLALPADFFISNAHLGARGRAWFTASLEKELSAL